MCACLFVALNYTAVIVEENNIQSMGRKREPAFLACSGKGDKSTNHSNKKDVLK